MEERKHNTDVVEIVRCIDCQHCEQYASYTGWCNKHQRATAFNDYCSYGERR